jgi:hypothetical protein
MSFFTIVVSVAIAVLLITLAIVALALYTGKSKVSYPPVVGKCPDYWVDQSTSNNGSVCKDVKGIGNAGCLKTMNFSTMDYQGTAGLCKKKKWAKDCGVSWDGISNNDKVCDTVGAMKTA